MARSGTPARKGVAEVNCGDDEELNNLLSHRFLMMFERRNDLIRFRTGWK